MSQQAKPVLPDVIADPLEFAREGGCLSGYFPVVRLERLHDLLAEPSGEIAWQARGSVVEAAGGVRRHYLELDLEGELRLVCQRCLGAYAWPVRLAGRLELVAPGEPWPDEELEDDSCDAIEATRNLALSPLVEDEILLTLPQSPRHEECVPPGGPGKGRDGKPSPFAALAALKDLPEGH